MALYLVGESEVEDHVPSVLVFDFAQAYRAEGLVEAGGHGAGLAVFGDDIFDVVVEVVDFAYGGGDGGCAACGCLLEVGNFVNGDVMSFGFRGSLWCQTPGL